MKVAYLKDEFGNADKNYVIAKDGSYIRDKRTGKKLTGIYINKGYRIISITLNKINYHQIKIAILQWRTWKGSIPKKYNIHHAGKDKNNKFDKTNDHIYCLKCLTVLKHQRIHHKNKPGYWLGRTGAGTPMFGKTGYWTGKYGIGTPMYGRTGKSSPRYGKPGYWLGKKGKDHPGFGYPGSMLGMTGEKCPTAKLTNIKIKRIFYFRYIEKMTQKEITNKFNVCLTCIRSVLLGHTWNSKSLTKDQLMNNFLNSYYKEIS